MNGYVAAASYALITWWCTTGIILFLDRLPRATFGRSMVGATCVLPFAFYGVHTSAAQVSVVDVYEAFTCAILVWGFLEMSFLLGFITGPRTRGCPMPCSGPKHFLHATQAIIYNELATLLTGIVLFVMTFHAPNRVAFWTFLILWTMRLSAKLNLFLGVPNVGEQFLPDHLQYLKTFFRKRPMNLLFPVSILGATLASVALARAMLASHTSSAGTGYALLTSLLTLAVIEHCFMVLPVPSERLWHWALKYRAAAPVAARPTRPTLKPLVD